MHFSLDLSAPVDVYSEWVDACDEVAKHAPDANTAEDDIQSYGDLATGGNGRRNSEMLYDRHVVEAVDPERAGGYDDDDDNI